MRKRIFSMSWLLLSFGLFNGGSVLGRSLPQESRSVRLKPYADRPQFGQFLTHPHLPIRRLSPLKVASVGMSTMIQPKVVGGGPIVGEAPWIVSLILKNWDGSSLTDPYQGHFCTGALISPRFVITAAHCLVDRKVQDFEILLNTPVLKPGVGERVGVQEIILHPYYDANTLENDLALVLLKEPRRGQVWIGLGESSSLYTPGSLAMALGWGATDPERTQYPRDLQSVQLPLVSLDVANASQSWNGQLFESQLPAGYAAGGKDTCAGDSGGPLVIRDDEGAFRLIGVTSFGPDPCAQPNLYGIYSRVQSELDWISSIITPYFYAWSLDHDVIGWDSDPDGDGFSNLEEYALGLDPKAADQELLHLDPPIFYPVKGISLKRAAVRFVRRKSGEINAIWASDRPRGHWSILEELFDQADLTGFPDFESASALGNLSDHTQQFFKMHPVLGTQYVPFIRYLQVGLSGAAAPVITASLEPRDHPYDRADLRYSKDYLLTHLSAAGGALSVQANSADFRTVLQLFDENDNELVKSSVAPGQSSVSLRWNALAGKQYVLRVTTVSEGETGTFTLSAFER